MIICSYSETFLIEKRTSVGQFYIKLILHSTHTRRHTPYMRACTHTHV